MQGAVFYIAGEGHSGFTRRFAAWGHDRGVPLKNALMFKSNRAVQFLEMACLLGSGLLRVAGNQPRLVHTPEVALAAPFATALAQPSAAVTGA